MVRSKSIINGTDNTRLFIILGVLAFAIIVGVLIGSSYRENFTGESTNQIGLLYFYMETCPHCNDFNSIWKDLSSKYSDIINFYKIDLDGIDKETNKKNAEKYGVTSAPTIRLKIGAGDYITYDQNQRTKEDIIRWVSEKTQQNIPIRN